VAQPIQLISSYGARESPARTRPARRQLFRIAAVQERWHEDPDEHSEALAAAIRRASDEGAQLVCLQELTLSRYFAADPAGPRAAGVEPERLPGGPTYRFATRMAGETGVYVHASLYERADPDASPDQEPDADAGSDVDEQPDADASPDEHPLGFNTAILVAPDGELVARTRKLHIPVTAGYHEDRYFRPGPGGEDAFPLSVVGEARLGLPTCWDQWFPELARAYSLEGADVLVYPTAIGSEPDHPDFDTEPLWERVIVGNAIANGVFIVAVNRTGEEPPLRFYGSSFICDPYGRKLVQAPREEPALLVADLDLDQRRDWLELFPFLSTRRPDAYARLLERADELGEQS
jgi:N-carbamoylputrescine amidase